MGSGRQNKLTWEQVLNDFTRVHGDKFDYSNVDYVNNTTKIEVRCKKHDFIFHPTPKNHRRGTQCKKCGRESQIEKASKGKDKFIEEGIEIFGDKDDYSLVDYVNTKTKVDIICSIHGKFEVQPDAYIRGLGCEECRRKKTKSTDKDMFLEEVYKIYGDKNDYSNTVVGDSRGKIDVVCKEHGEFIVYMSAHFSGQGCPKCAMTNYSLIRTKTTDEFINQAKEVHGDNCDYSSTVYKGCRERVKIKCNKHDVIFKQFPANHLSGGSCRQCLRENLSKALLGRDGTGGYTRSSYAKQANGREACVYLIRCYDEKEEFYKIGKTFLDINKRFTKGNLIYDFEEVHFHYGEASYIFDLENELHRQYRPYKHRPKEWFAGYTECYSMMLPIEEIKALN